MNRKQRVVLLAAAALILLMLLFPPFRYMSPGGLNLNLGYSFILDPAETLSGQDGSIDVFVLLTQWAGVAIAAGAVAFVVKD